MQTNTTLYKKDLGNAVRFWKAELNKNSISLTWGLTGKIMGQRNTFFTFPEDANNYLQKAIRRMQERYTHQPETTALLLGIKLPKALKKHSLMDKDLMRFIFPFYCDVEDILSLNANGTMGKLQILHGIFWLPLKVIDRDLLLMEVDSMVVNTIYKKRLVTVHSLQPNQPTLK